MLRNGTLFSNPKKLTQAIQILICFREESKRVAGSEMVTRSRKPERKGGEIHKPFAKVVSQSLQTQAEGGYTCVFGCASATQSDERKIVLVVSSVNTHWPGSAHLVTKHSLFPCLHQKVFALILLITLIYLHICVYIYIYIGHNIRYLILEFFYTSQSY